uniref:Uncharacterized protein n=1 Tax=Zosterops lateralis melanops TaxID=1220523 RepID=A0A8D2NSH1_ZOSLA
MTMTANKNSTVNSRAGGSKVPQDTLDRCQSATPPPLLSPQRSPAYPLSDSEDSSRSTGLSKASRSRLCLKDWNSRTSTLRSTSTSPDEICKGLLNSISDAHYPFRFCWFMLA